MRARNPMIYIYLGRAIFKEVNDEFTVRAASDIEELCKLMEVGFEHVCDMDGKNRYEKGSDMYENTLTPFSENSYH